METHPFLFRIHAPYTDTNRFVLHLRDGNGNDGSGELKIDPQRMVPGTTMTWARFLERYVKDDVTEDQFTAFGRDLFGAIIGEVGLGEVWSNIAAASQGLPLLMTVEFSRNTEVMAELPLELLHDSVNFVFARPGSGIERTLLGTPARVFTAPSIPSVLFAWACPPGSGDQFDPDPHGHVLQEIFKDKVEFLPNASRKAITTTLQKDKFDYLHIMAHGYRDPQNAGICLNGNNGGIDYVAAQRLANAVQDCGLKFVFLCSCQTAVAKDKAFSGVGQQLLAQQGGDISCVVATQANLPVRDSEILVERFYRLLAETKNPAQALTRARRDAFGKGRAAWSVPVLLTRPKDVGVMPAVNIGLPAKRETYQAREQEREGLEALCQNRLVSLVGLPGIGKTECGKEIARTAVEQGIFDKVIYQEILPGYTAGQVRALLGTALNQTGIKDNMELAALFTARDQKILLLVDNAEDLMKLPAEETGFRSMVDTLLAYTENISILLTTRWLLGGTQVPERELEVPPMSLDLTAKLLEAELRQRGVFKSKWPNTPVWREILKIVDGHPRSLWLISGHFDQRRGTPEYVLAKLKRYKEEAILEPGLLGRADLLEVLKDDQKQRLRSLVASMNFSFEVLEKRHPDAVHVYMGLSLFPSGLPDKVAQEVAGGAGTLALDHLYRYHLAAWHNDRMFYPVPLHWYADRLRRARDIDETLYMKRALTAFKEYVSACDEQIINGAIVAGTDAILAEETNLLNLAQWIKSDGKDVPEYSKLAGIA
ncbi:MAG: CHAT domain-containing protein, partial [Desulfobacteraceae bacterium]